ERRAGLVPGCDLVRRGARLAGLRRRLGRVGGQPRRVLRHGGVRRLLARHHVLPMDELVFKPLTPSRIEDFAHVLKSSASGTSCWDIWPRLTGTEQRDRGLDGAGAKRRATLGALAKRRRAPGLLAYRGREAVGWISVGPRL